MSLRALALNWRIDGPDATAFLVLVAAIGTLYLLAAARGNSRDRRGRRWPRRRSVCFIAALAVLVLDLYSGIGAQADQRLSAHMLEHMVIWVVVAPLLAAGAPVRLAFYALPRRGRRTLARWLHSGSVSALTSAAGSILLFSAALLVQARNPNVIAWYQQLPYAWLDPCARNLEFNTAIEPWNNKDMRWAVNYAIDRNQIVAVAYEGTTLPSKFFFPAYGPLNKLVDAADAAGVYDRNPILVHDPDKAKQLIEANGYTMGSDGFYQKDGQQLGLTITTSDTATEHQRIIAVEVEQLQAVGINAVQKNEAEAVWADNRDFGRFEARQGWDNCGSVNEPWKSLDTLNAKWIVPIGQRAPTNGNPWRWNNPEYSALVDQIGTLPLGDPRVQDLFVKAADIYLSELPTIPITQAKKLIPFDTTHWTGWPTHDNNYIHATTWWQMTPVILQNLHSTGR